MNLLSPSSASLSPLSRSQHFTWASQKSLEPERPATADSQQMGLEPTNASLSVEYAMRFQAVVEEAAERIDLLHALVNDVVANIQHTGDDMFELLADQQQLERHYETLMQRRSELKGVTNKSKFLATQSELREIGQAIRISTLKIREKLNQDKSAAKSDQKKVQKDRKELLGLLSTVTSELGRNEYPSLIDYIRTESEQKHALETQLKNQLDLQKTLSDMKQKVEQESQMFEQKLSEKNERLTALVERLSLLRNNSAVRTNFIQNSEQAHMESVNRVRLQHLQTLENDLNDSQRRAELDNAVNQMSTQFLNKKRIQLEKEAEFWESKYTTEYAQLCTELEDLTRKHQEEAELLAHLRERDKQETEERRLREKLDKAESVAQARRERLLRMMHIAQCKIRFVWRVYQRRKANQKAKKAKKAPKKSKKSAKNKK